MFPPKKSPAPGMDALAAPPPIGGPAPKPPMPPMDPAQPDDSEGEAKFKCPNCGHPLMVVAPNADDMNQDDGSQPPAMDMGGEQADDSQNY